MLNISHLQLLIGNIMKRSLVWLERIFLLLVNLYLVLMNPFGKEFELIVFFLILTAITFPMQIIFRKNEKYGTINKEIYSIISIILYFVMPS